MKYLFSKYTYISAINTILALSGILVLNSTAHAACVDQVPTLSGSSSNVTTSGNFDSTYPGWKAFDASGSMWLSETWETPAWISYQFSTTKKIDRYTIEFTNGSLTSRAPKNFQLQGSNGSGWVTLDTRTNQTGWQHSETRAYTVSNPGNYSRYRLNVTDDNDSRSGVVVLSIGDLELQTCSSDVSLNCYTAGTDVTLCSYSGDYVSGMTFYWNSNSSYPIIYPSSGSFPYTTNNGSIIFQHQGQSSCPPGVQISVSTSLSGYASFTCQ